MPLAIGGQGTLELPGRLLVQGEVGVLPGGYVDAADGILVGAGAYDAAASEVIRSAFRDSLVVRLSAGWRPFPDHGLEVFGGYTMVSLGAGVTARDAVEAVAGVALPVGVGNDELEVETTLHGVHAAIGWRWVLAEHLSIRASLGYLQAVAASTSIAVPSSVSRVPGASSAVAPAITLAEEQVDGLLTDHVKLPVIGLAVGYRF